MTTSHRILALAALGLAAAAQAAPVLVTTPAALAANDSVGWAQLGVDGTVTAASFGALSANALTVNVALAGSDACVAVVGGSVCGWTAGTGFVPGDSILWTESATTYTGTGPLTLNFAPSFGVGLYLQATAAGTFTASLSAYDGAVLLGTFSVASADGSGTFIGALNSVANISRIQVGLMSCSSGCDIGDFGVNSLLLKGQAATVPEPSSGGSMLLGLGGLALSCFRQRRCIGAAGARDAQA